MAKLNTPGISILEDKLQVINIDPAAEQLKLYKNESVIFTLDLKTGLVDINANDLTDIEAAELLAFVYSASETVELPLTTPGAYSVKLFAEDYEESNFSIILPYLGYLVNLHLSNITATGDTHFIRTAGQANIQFTVSSNYRLPQTIAVTGASYTYVDGIVILTNPTGDVTIEAAAYKVADLPILDYNISLKQGRWDEGQKKIIIDTVAIDPQGQALIPHVSTVAPFNVINVKFTSDVSLSYYEVRITPDATHTIDEDDIGIGTRPYFEINIPAQTEHSFTIPVNTTYFTQGDGLYKIGLYAKGSLNGAWDVTYLFMVLSETGGELLLQEANDKNVIEANDIQLSVEGSGEPVKFQPVGDEGMEMTTHVDAPEHTENK